VRKELEITVTFTEAEARAIIGALTEITKSNEFGTQPTLDALTKIQAMYITEERKQQDVLARSRL
jgi:hypothetical protein